MEGEDGCVFAAVLITHRGQEGANPCNEQQEGNSVSQKRTLDASVACLCHVYLVLRNQVLFYWQKSLLQVSNGTVRLLTK